MEEKKKFSGKNISWESNRIRQLIVKINILISSRKQDQLNHLSHRHCRLLLSYFRFLRKLKLERKRKYLGKHFKECKTTFINFKSTTKTHRLMQFYWRSNQKNTQINSTSLERSFAGCIRRRTQLTKHNQKSSISWKLNWSWSGIL